jgi:hypothetical protein
MSRSVLAVIEFDDNTPPNEPAFTNEGSIWSLQEDWGLLGCKDYKFMGAISGIQDSTHKGPLIPLRGLPRNAAQSVKQLQDELITGWLTYNEIIASLEHHSVKVETLDPAVLRVLDVMRLLGAKLSEDRVRLVFAIDV